MFTQGCVKIIARYGYSQLYACDFCRGQDSFLIHSHTVPHTVAYLKSAPNCGKIFSSFLTLHTAIHCGLFPHCLVPPYVDMCVMGVLCTVEQVILLKWNHCLLSKPVLC